MEPLAYDSLPTARVALKRLRKVVATARSFAKVKDEATAVKAEAAIERLLDRYPELRSR
jgi:hypothetical protein